MLIGAAGGQVVGEFGCQGAGDGLILVGHRIDLRQALVPLRRQLEPVGKMRHRHCLFRPSGEVLVEQRQVEQPFAGIVDNVEMQTSAAECA